MGFTNRQRVFPGHNGHAYKSLDSIMGDAEIMYAKTSWMPVTLKRGAFNDPEYYNLPIHYIDVFLCVTPVVRHYSDSLFCPHFRINNGGWATSHTVFRVNEFLPDGWGVYSDKGLWWLTDHIGRYSYPYAHNITVHADCDVTGMRHKDPEFIRLNGKRVPRLTIPEYIDRAFITLAKWEVGHRGYEDGTRPKWLMRRFGGGIVSSLEEIRELMHDMKEADTPEDLLTTTLNANHIMHMTLGPTSGAKSQYILKDYGKPNGLHYEIINAISNGPDEYFGQDEIDRFLALDTFPKMPEYITAGEYNELRKSDSFLR